MAKKLSSIEDSIQTRSAEFNEHIQSELPSDVLKFVEKLQARTQVFLFSGLIRDFFLRANYGLRDVDFIINDNLDIKKLFPRLKVSKNSFNGYKTRIGSLSVDLWGLENTWALNHGQLKFPFRKELEYLPQTTFFNFSSIVFLMNEQKFVIGEPFLKFMRDKVLDIVLEDNPYPSLCIVNSIYYSEKYKLKLSRKLKEYIVDHYRDQSSVLEIVQMKHFNKILYSKRNLARRIREINESIVSEKAASKITKPADPEKLEPLFSSSAE